MKKHIEVTLDVDDEKGAGAWSYLSPSPRYNKTYIEPTGSTDDQVAQAAEAARNEAN